MKTRSHAAVKLLPMALAVTFASLLLFSRTQSTQAQAARDKMTWEYANDSAALCNDFTRAGYFIRRNNESPNWLIFLESGGLCYSRDSCNRRFFVREVREREGIRDDREEEIVPYGRFNPFHAWNQTVFNNPSNASSTVSPLMSSMQCFVNEKKIEITGRDILDTDPTQNPLFYDYNHVLIPYCSSDLWLGEENDTTSAVRSDTVNCDCFDYVTESNTNGCFNFSMEADDLLFTFRGKTIYRSIIEQLIDLYRLDNSSKVVLAGSSAGGVGVLNHAKWTRGRLNNSSSTEMNVLIDSSWFIDFLDGIENIFNLGTSVNSSDTERLLNTLRSNEACNDTDQFGYPCCISAHCILTQMDDNGRLQYYPESTSTFALFSVYDIYLLTPGLSTVANIESSTNAGDGSLNGGLSVVLDFLRIAGEYGGTMNYTLDVATTQASFLSYYVTQCFQHIYFATSTLWGDESSVFGSDSLEFTQGMASFRHDIQSGRWNSLNLTANITILNALTQWQNGQRVEFRDSCQGVLCNNMCPDELQLGQLTSNNWPVWSKIFIVVLVVGLAVLCILIEVAFIVWLCLLERKQDAYLDELEGDEEQPDVLMFPVCDEDDAIAVSCLNLHYSVKFKAKKAVKDEKKDQTAPIVLSNLADQDSESETEEEPGFTRRKTTRYRRLSVSQRRQSQFALPSLLRNATSYFSNIPSETPNVELKRFSGSHETKPTNVWSSPTKKNGSQKKQVSSDFVQAINSQMGAGATTPSEEVKTAFGGRVVKEILKGISIYFNPGEMIGIMGPSGCGKTTFLDLLTARRKTGTFKGEIYINGIPIEEVHDWYVANTGYVLQLAAPYYEELTVRENLTLAAQMKLPKTFTLREKFERVEQVLEVTGLLKLANTPVGGATGPGLSGGQKKRLVIALQLLKMPSVIFLDEPTSGLDATASFELLTHLNKLADSNRTVILTIHQPRLEIFHMFHRLVLLSDGKVSYHGAPEKAYEVFVNALTSRFLAQGFIIPSLEDHNPADVIMDMLGNFRMRQIITENYQSSSEPKLVERAIKQARWREYSLSVSSLDSVSSFASLKQFFQGSKTTGERHGSNLVRMATLEARASKSVSFSVLIFLPFMFFLFAFIMGTTYVQETVALSVIAGICVFSTSSALFMFPAMYLYYQPALRVYGFEKDDGIGRAHDLVIQGFIRFQSVSFLPIILSTTLIYLLLVNAASYDVLIFFQVVLTNLALNQTWIALLIALICAFPAKAFRLSPIVAAVAGFTSGFFVPVGALGWWYRWAVYINPNYFGLSSVAFLILSDFDTDCNGSELECFAGSGPYLLSQFFFNEINPYLHIVILFSFTLFYLILAVVANWARHTSISLKLKRICCYFNKGARDTLTKEFSNNFDEYERTFSLDRNIDQEEASFDSDVYHNNGHLNTLQEEDEEEEEETEVEEETEEEGQKEGEGEKERGETVTREQTNNELGFGGPSSDRAADETTTKSKWQTMAARSLDLAEEEQQAKSEDQESGWNKVKRVRIQQGKRPSKLQLGTAPTPKLVSVLKQAQSIYLREGESYKVWRPKKQISDKVAQLNEELKQEREPSPVKPSRQISMTPSVSKSSLRSRQKSVFRRAYATQAVLKETNDDLLKEEDEEQEGSKPKLSLREASKRITATVKKQQQQEKGRNVSDVVSQYLAKMKSEDREGESAADDVAPPSFLRRAGTRRGAIVTNTPGAIKLTQWKKIVRENKTHSANMDEWDGPVSPANAYARSQSQYPLNYNIPGTPEEALSPNGHKKIHKTSSDSSVSKRVAFSDQVSSPQSKSPGVEFSHRPLVKQDSHGIHKQSKMAKLKQNAKKRPSVQRQNAAGSLDSAGMEEELMESEEDEEENEDLSVPSLVTKSQPKEESVGSLDEASKGRPRTSSTSSVDSQGRPKRSSPDQGWIGSEEKGNQTPPSSAKALLRPKFKKVEPAPQLSDLQDNGDSQPKSSGSSGQSRGGGENDHETIAVV